MLKTIFDRQATNLRTLADGLRHIRGLEAQLSSIREALGRLESRQVAAAGTPLEGAAFRVFSQWGEDGLVDWLVRNVPCQSRVFVEFGVGDYRESNTRFLLVHRQWSGLVLDASASDVARIRGDELYWKYNLKAECRFITRENIDGLLHEQGITGEIGLLSIDVDGNDLWIWEAISGVRPAIVIVEYNARFGPDRAVSVPYRPDFDRQKAHPSMVYYGASLEALARVGRRKGYALVACGPAGGNAFFVRRDLLPPGLAEKPVNACFVKSHVRESRDDAGRLAFLTDAEEAALLATMPLVEIAP